MRNFLSRCLQTDPTQRWDARQLLAHPWLEEASRAYEERSRRKQGQGTYGRLWVWTMDAWAFDSDSNDTTDPINQQVKGPTPLAAKRRKRQMSSRG